MNLPKYAIKNHQFTIIIILMMVILGIVSVFTMPRSEDPQVSPPGTTVFVIYPGANPLDLEELVLDPVEEVINELNDIKHLRGVARDGYAQVEVEFEAGTDPDDKFSDVVQKVNSIKSDLPKEIIDLQFIQWESSNVNIIQLALVSDVVSYRSLENEADRLKKMLDVVPGLKKTKIVAFPEQEIQVEVDFEKVALNKISLDTIFKLLQSNNANIPGGNIDIGRKRFTVQTSGSFKNIDEIKNMIVDAKNGNIIYLKDIASIHYGYEEQKHLARFNKKRTVFISATQKEKTNIYKVIDGINHKLVEFTETLPEEIKVERVFDQSESVSFRLVGFFQNLLQGLILVGIVVFLAVGFRSSIIVMIVIPFSVLIGIGFLDLSNFGLEQMSIAGMVIALGLLVDNAIVVIENISRFMKQGYNPVEAAIEGTKQIGWAVVSSTITTVLAFVPIILIQDKTGDFIRSMPTTVVYTLLASLFISLTLTPYLSSKFIKKSASNKNGKFRKSLDGFVENKYKGMLYYCLINPKKVVTVSLVIFVGSLMLFPLVGVSFFPEAEKSQFLINIETPEGTSFDRVDDIVKEIEDRLTITNNVKSFASNIGNSNPVVYYNVLQKRNKPNFGQILVEIEKNDKKMLRSVLTELRSHYQNYIGAKIEIKSFKQGPISQAPIAIRVVGKDLQKLKKLSYDVEQIFNGIDDVINVNNPFATSKPDLHININREKAGLLGVPIYEIDRAIRTAVAGIIVGKYNDNVGKEFNIVVKMKTDSNKFGINTFQKIFVTSFLNEQIPLSQIAKLEFKETPLLVRHYKLERENTITADVVGGKNVTMATNNIVDKLEQYDWPKGYTFKISGDVENQQESFGGMAKAVLIAILGIFGVLVLQFRSYSQPLIVFSAIPLALIGAILGLLITGFSFSFTAFVGITSLVGIVINNSIILVDYANQLRREGKEILESLLEAGQTRFAPIILTTATTIGGLFPLTIGGSSLWAPMGWTIIGGLMVSTILTLIIVPVLYKLFTK